MLSITKGVDYEVPKFELARMFNRSTSPAILYGTC